VCHRHRRLAGGRDAVDVGGLEAGIASADEAAVAAARNVRRLQVRVVRKYRPPGARPRRRDDGSGQAACYTAAPHG